LLTARRRENNNMTFSDQSDELDIVRMLCGDDFAELAALYMTDSPKRIATLREAFAADDRARIVKVAHAFCGSCTSIGATGLSALCRDLELCAWTIDAAELAQKLDLIEAGYDRIRTRLRTMVGPGA
jgi:HPt (histidine-containing phosphotransfer) domain-containing protein